MAFGNITLPSNFKMENNNVKNDGDQAFQNVTKIREMATIQLAKGYKCFSTHLGHKVNKNGWDQKKNFPRE